MGRSLAYMYIYICMYVCIYVYACSLSEPRHSLTAATMGVLRARHSWSIRESVYYLGVGICKSSQVSCAASRGARTSDEGGIGFWWFGFLFSSSLSFPERSRVSR